MTGYAKVSEGGNPKSYSAVSAPSVVSRHAPFHTLCGLRKAIVNPATNLPRTQFDAQERMVYAVHIAETLLGLRARNREIERDKLRTKAQKLHNAKKVPNCLTPASSAVCASRNWLQNPRPGRSNPGETNREHQEILGVPLVSRTASSSQIVSLSQIVSCPMNQRIHQLVMTAPRILKAFCQ